MGKNRILYKLEIGILIVILVAFALIFFKSKAIKIDKASIKKFIQVADEHSYDKLQINWKYLYAIIAAENKGNVKKIGNEEIGKLADRFIENNKSNVKLINNDYKLKKIETVLNEIHIEDKSQVDKYLDKLKDAGLVKIDDKQRKFINSLEKEAIEGYYNFGILPSVIISQAIVESGWGKSKLTLEANNMFGIKADNSWKGKTTTMKTKENYNDVLSDKFRKYDNLSDSIKDYVKFLSNNKRYKKNGVFISKHYMKQTENIEKAGYSTAKNEKGQRIYSKLLVDIIKEYNLQLIDSKAQTYYFK